MLESGFENGYGRSGSRHRVLVLVSVMGILLGFVPSRIQAFAADCLPFHHRQTRLFSSIDPLVSPNSSAAKQLRKKKDMWTFTRYLEVECWKLPELRGLETALIAVSEACKQISRIVQRAKTDDIYGVAVDVNGNPLDGTNVQGEVQQKLDVLCNTIMLRAFCGSSSHIHSVASEEEDEPRCCSDIMVRTFVLVRAHVLSLHSVCTHSFVCRRIRLLRWATLLQCSIRSMDQRILMRPCQLVASLAYIERPQGCWSTRRHSSRLADRWLLRDTAYIRKLFASLS